VGDHPLQVELFRADPGQGLLGVHRRPGMGGGLVPLATDATAVHYNPAGLANLEYQEIAFTHSMLFEQSAFDFAAWVYPITEDHGVGGGLMHFGTDDIIRRVDFADRGRFDYSYTQLMLAYGRNIGQLFAAGTTLKIVHQSLDNSSDFGIGLDAGFTAEIYEKLSLGVVARDILQPKLKLGEIIEKTPPSASAGISLRDFSLSDQARLTVTCELEKQDDRAIRVHTGSHQSRNERMFNIVKRNNW